MPIKRRTDKSRHLDTYRLEMLRDGPFAQLIAGAGYLAEAGLVSHFAAATDEQRAAILDAMRADWQRHCERLKAEGGDWWAETGL
jgi:hypothetical protein